MTRSPRSFYVFKSSNVAANANVDYGFGNGNYVAEFICSLARRRNIRLTGHYLFRLQKDANNDIRIDSDGAGAYRTVVISAAGTSTYPLYVNIMSFEILTLVLSVAEFSAFVDGQKIISDTVTPRKPNLTGVCAQTILAGSAGTSVHDICAARITEEASLPADLINEIARRSINPWNRSTLLSVPKLEFLLDSNIAGASANIPCTGSGGGGCDAPIVPASTWTLSRQLWRTP